MVRVGTLVIVLAACTAAWGNVGVFTGSGQTIKLVRSAEVQMVSEEVTIVPGRGRFPFDGGVGGMDRVEYQCKFVLKNLAKTPVAIQVGFPLDSQFFKAPYTKEKVDDTETVLRYKFIARDRDKTYHIRFVPYDKTKRLAAIFMWDMDFRPEEVRELHVAYEMPISMSLASGAKSQSEKDQNYAKHWYCALQGGTFEGFGYVTETGRSWAGPIEKAEIRVHLAGFEKYLKNRRVFEESEEPTEPSDPRNNKRRRHAFFDGYCRDWLIHRQIEPEGWTEKDSTITWQFQGQVPEKPVHVSYLVLHVPQSVEGLRAMVQSTLVAPAASDSNAAGVSDIERRLAEETGESKLAGNLADLREILLATWGVAPANELIRTFVENQVWYAPQRGVTEKGLTVQQKQVLDELDRMSR